MPKLNEAFWTIANGLSEMDFLDADKEILKGVCQEIVEGVTKQRLKGNYAPSGC